MAPRRSAASPALLPGALFLAALAAWPRIPQPPAYLAPTATNVEPSQAPASEDIREAPRDGWQPKARDGWQPKDWRKRRRPRREPLIRHVGQRLSGKVVGFAETKSGAAHVDVGGIECILMPKDWTRPLAVGDDLEDLWVRHIVEERDDLFFVSMHPIKFHSKHLRKNDRLRGTVLRTTELGVYLDVGATHDALLFPNQISRLVHAIFRRPLEPGDEIDVWVRSVRKDSRFLVTTFGPRREAESFKTGEKVTGILRKVLPWKGAFVDVMATKDGYLTGWELEDSDLRAVGDRAEFYVHAFTKEKGLRLTLEKPKTSMEDLKAGSKIRGTVKSAMSGGSYTVDVGAVEDVVLNMRDMPEEGVVIGENVTAWVKEGIGKKRRGWIHVTMREPKIKSMKMIRIDDWFSGKVTNYNKANDDGGIFVDIGWVKHALVRRQEFPPDLVDKGMLEAFKIGQEVQVRVTNTHRDGQVDASMRPAEEPAESRGVV